MQKNLNQAEMAESYGIETKVIQVAMQVVASVMIALRGTDVGP